MVHVNWFMKKDHAIMLDSLGLGAVIAKLPVQGWLLGVAIRGPCTVEGPSGLL